MAIRITRWTLDTCGCSVEYAWDDEIAAPTRVHTYTRSISKCDVHRTLEGKQHYDVIKEENFAKNGAYVLALKHLARKVGENKTDEGGNEFFGLKDGISFNYSFSGVPPNRVLHISFSGATIAGDKNALQSVMDSEFGSGKVAVE